MKKILFAMALAAIAMICDAQLVVDSVGHVGIGTQTPWTRPLLSVGNHGGVDLNATIQCSDQGRVPYVWHKDVYIQNEDIVASNREYHAKNVKVGNHVTDQKPQGNVTITNSNVTIKADKVVLDRGTKINLGSTLKINALH